MQEAFSRRRPSRVRGLEGGRFGTAKSRLGGEGRAQPPGWPQPLSGSPVASAGDLPAALFRTLRSRGSQREKRPMTPPDRPGVPTVPHPGRGRRYATDLLLLFITMGTVRLPGPSLGADGVTDGVVTLPALEVLSYALGTVRSASGLRGSRDGSPRDAALPAVDVRTRVSPGSGPRSPAAPKTASAVRKQ